MEIGATTVAYILYHAKSIAPYSKRRGEKPRLNFGAVG